MRIDRDVADLAARAVGTINDLAVDDDAAADTRAQRDHDSAAAALGGAHPDLAQGGDVGVVADKDLQAVQQAGQLDGNVPLAPAAEVGTDDGHDAGVQHRAGHTDAHALDLLCSDLLLGHLAVNGVGQIFEDVLTGVGGVGGHLPLFQQCAGRGEQTDLCGGAAQVNAKCVFFHDSFTPFPQRSPADRFTLLPL